MSLNVATMTWQNSTECPLEIVNELHGTVRVVCGATVLVILEWNGVTAPSARVSVREEIKNTQIGCREEILR